MDEQTFTEFDVRESQIIATSIQLGDTLSSVFEENSIQIFSHWQRDLRIDNVLLISDLFVSIYPTNTAERLQETPSNNIRRSMMWKMVETSENHSR